MLLRNALSGAGVEVGEYTYSGCVRACGEVAAGAVTLLIGDRAIESPLDFSQAAGISWIAVQGPPRLPTKPFFRREILQAVVVGSCWAIRKSVHEFFGDSIEKIKVWSVIASPRGCVIKLRLYTPGEELRLTGAFVLQGELRAGDSEPFHGVWASLENFLKKSFLLQETLAQGESVLEEF